MSTTDGAIYGSKEHAAKIAKALGASGDDWTYSVIEVGDRFKVEVRDEEGVFVAFWGS